MALATKDVLTERAEILREIEGRTLLTAFAETAERLRDQPALKWKEGDTWCTLTWREFREAVLDVAAGLQAIGFLPGEFTVIMSRNRPEAVIADLATQHARGVPVHLYNTLPPEQIEYIANHCEAAIGFLEDESFLARFDVIRDRVPLLRRTVLFDGGLADRGGWTDSWAEVLAKGRKERQRNPGGVEAASREVGPEDIATVIYTSGTTGPPKGVIDTHRSILYMLAALNRLLEPRSDERIISYLPLAHAAGRTADVWLRVVSGGTVHFCPDLMQLVPYMLEVRPTSLASVPRVWEKLHAGLTAGIASIPDQSIRTAADRAIDVGRQVARKRQRGEEPSPEVLQEHERGNAIRKAIRAKVGLDDCDQAASGAAPIDPAIIEFFGALGIQMGEVWGMTELACVSTGTTLDRIRTRTVGCALPGVEMKLAADGELLVRGPLVTKGYYKDPEKTAEAIDHEGWLHTGDIGEIDPDGYLKITDRKKELIINSAGKNISPANIEYFLKSNPLIGQACAIGDRRNYVSALLVLDPMTASVWAKQHGIEASLDELSRDPQILREIQRAIDAANEHLARVEQVKKFTVLPNEWTPESGELTPTLKLKRRVILERYTTEIAVMYRG